MFITIAEILVLMFFAKVVVTFGYIVLDIILDT